MNTLNMHVKLGTDVYFVRSGKVFRDLAKKFNFSSEWCQGCDKEVKVSHIKHADVIMYSDGVGTHVLGYTSCKPLTKVKSFSLVIKEDLMTKMYID